MPKDKAILPLTARESETMNVDRRAVLGAVGASALLKGTSLRATPVRQPQARTPSGPSDPEWIYHHKKGNPPYNKTPYSMYFYYDGLPSGAGVPSIRHYLYESATPIPEERLRDLIAQLALEARQGQHVRPWIGTDWLYIYWNRVSYITVFVDDPARKLLQNGAVGFNRRHEGHFNHSFFDAIDFDIDLGDADGIRTAVCFINHSKQDASGTQLDHHQYFNFDIFFRGHPFFYPDSGGTNMGPPVPPP